MKKENETNTATLEKSTEGGPLAQLLKAQEETNSLLRQVIKAEEPAKDEPEDKKEKEEEAKEKDEKGFPPELMAEAKKAVKKEMEQTTQTAPKKVSAEGPWKPEVTNAEECEPGDKEKPYPYPISEAKDVKKAFPFPYGNIASKREEVLAKQLDNANQEISRLNGTIAKMIPADKVEEMVNARFQQKMAEEGFVTASGALPANVEKAEPSEIRKSVEAPGDEQTEAENVAKQVTGQSWENIIAMRRSIDPAYRAFLGNTRGLPLRGGM